jgi:hypothetical protein
MDPAVTTLDRLNTWKSAGIITDAQHGTLGALVRKDRFSVFLELSALLYLGVLFFVGGVGWTFREYVDDLGDGVIISALTLMVAATFYYCFTRAEPYDPGEVESPNLVFDYILYLGCLLLSTEVAYLQYRFEILRSWHHHLLIGALVFGVLAYRFDNRFVLSMALSSLAGWLGLRVGDFSAMSSDVLRMTALLYGAFIAGLGTWLSRQHVKAHFLDVYLHLAANVVLAAVASGLGDPPTALFYLAVLIALSAASIGLGIRFRRFAFVAYGVVYGYAGISYELLDAMDSPTAALLYFFVTGSLVIVALVVLARRFGREE